MPNQNDKEEPNGDGPTINSECEGTVQPPTDEYRYALCGRQVEPEAGLWLNEPQIRVPSLQDVYRYVGGDERPKRPLLKDQELSGLLVRTRIVNKLDFPNEAQLDDQLDLLKQLAEVRGDAYPEGRTFGVRTGALTVTPLSRFLHLQPPPFGTIFDVKERDTVGIRKGEVNQQRERLNENWLVFNEGQELARAFEDETPGLYHRHALNWLLYRRPDISPPRHARIWLALDMAIYTALSAAWYFKWFNPSYGRLLRPAEYARRCGDADGFSVLYDAAVNDDGQEINARPRPPQCEKDPEGGDPGTPRHPAWPSGHSTYSAAGSHLLEYLVSPDTRWLDDAELEKRINPTKPNYLDPAWLARELRRLADNIGEARLWAGVHWLADHRAGQKLGRAAAEAVIERLEQDGVSPVDVTPAELPPPDFQPFDPSDQQKPPRPKPTRGQDTLKPPVPAPEEQERLSILPPT